MRGHAGFGAPVREPRRCCLGGGEGRGSRGGDASPLMVVWVGREVVISGFLTLARLGEGAVRSSRSV